MQVTLNAIRTLQFACSLVNLTGGMRIMKFDFFYLGQEDPNNPVVQLPQLTNYM